MDFLNSEAEVKGIRGENILLWESIGKKRRKNWRTRGREKIKEEGKDL